MKQDMIERISNAFIAELDFVSKSNKTTNEKLEESDVLINGLKFFNTKDYDNNCKILNAHLHDFDKYENDGR